MIVDLFLSLLHPEVLQLYKLQILGGLQHKGKPGKNGVPCGITKLCPRCGDMR